MHMVPYPAGQQESQDQAAVELAGAELAHQPLAASSRHPGLVLKVDQVCVHPNGAERHSLLCSKPFVL